MYIDCCSVNKPSINSQPNLSEVDLLSKPGRGDRILSLKDLLYSVLSAENGIDGSDLLYKHILLFV